MKDISKTYSNGEITIVWKPSVCIHSTLCWKGETGLKSVFNPMEKPWIKPDGAETEAIIGRVNHCPSGALSFFYNDRQETSNDTAPGEKTEATQEPVVEILPNGPLLIHGNIHLKHQDEATSLKNTVTAFCRCGASANKPYCDGSHQHNGFKG
jgi:uncharacterized Fe-S cluster protein YjdI